VLVFWDESGASLLPVVRRTWAPRGHTPVIRHRCKWKRMSLAAALCYGAHGGAQLAFHRHPDAYDTDSLIEALGGQKATLRVGRAASASQPGDARLAWPPAVLAGGGAAARLRVRPQPDRGAMGQPQGVELANLAGDTLEEVTAAAERGSQRIRGTPHLAFSFLRHCGLSLW
jgi:hypothetical protein